MQCPFCAHPSTSVLQTREGVRRRQCPACYRRWNTREVMETEAQALDRAKELLPRLVAEIVGKAA